MGPLRVFLWGLVAVALVGFAWLSLDRRAQRLPAPSSTELPLSAIGGPWTLVGADGKPFSSAALAGRPQAVFFGFTHCPDVCPTTLARLAKLRRQLGRGDDAFSIVFITVDPARDGPAEVGHYATAFNTPVIGLTGSPAAIDKVKKQFGAFSETVGSGDDYTVNHTAAVFLMDKDGKFVATLVPEEGDEVALAKLKRLVG